MLSKDSKGVESIPLVIVGLDFRSAGANWRSRLLMSEDEQDSLSHRLEEAGMVNGFAFLDTCNRNEWMVSTINPQWTGDLLRAQMVRRLRGEKCGKTAPEPYIHLGEEAVRHIVRVSAGLESFVPGDRQIGYQVAKALDDARKRGRGSVILNGLSRATGRAARESVRIGIGDPTLRGVHDAAIRYLTDRMDSEKKYEVLLVGWGMIARQTFDSLRAKTGWRVSVCNRTVIAGSGRKIEPLEKLPQLISRSDAILVCTNALDYVIRPEHFDGIDPEGSLMIVDMGIPIQTDPDCAGLPGVRYLDLDGLEKSGVVQTWKNEEYRRVEAGVEANVSEFERFCRERDLVNVLKATQTQHERFIRELIPAMLDEELPGLSEADRSRLLFRLRGHIREYTNTIFRSIHQTTMGNSDGRE